MCAVRPRSTANLLRFGSRLNSSSETAVCRPAQSAGENFENPFQRLWEGFSKFSPADWAGRHTAVSEEEFKREPNRNKFTVLLGRTAHMSYHVGQAMLARPKAPGDR